MRQEEISQAVGVKGASLGYYLNMLRDLGLLERAVPATDADPAHSRQGRYQLLDPFFRFWFRFVYRERVHLERGDTATVRQVVSEQLDALAGWAFEETAAPRLGAGRRRPRPLPTATGRHVVGCAGADRRGGARRGVHLAGRVSLALAPPRPRCPG